MVISKLIGSSFLNKQKEIIYKYIPDKIFLKYVFNKKMGKKLDLKNPKTFNEKLQWLKLNDRREEYSKLVDKYEVREYIKERIGEDHLIPLLGIYNNFEEIDFNDLPDKFVLKCTHDSGGLVICKDKINFNIDKARDKINDCLKRNYYYAWREWPYKNIKPRIICEQYLEQGDSDELRDYRFFCFNGEVKFIAVDFSITNKEYTRRNLYDLNWNLLDEEISYPKELSIEVPKPEQLDQMIDYSRTLTSDIPHARVDFYYISGKVIFGEITLYHQSGLGLIRPEKFDELMGSWLQLPS